MSYPGTADWTEERVELLKKLWADRNLSAEMIAVKLGGISRNSVIGKAHRIGLPARGGRPKPKTSSRGVLAALKRKVSPSVQPKQPAPLFAGGFAALRQGPKTPPSPPPPAEATPGKGKRLLDLASDECHWAINDRKGWEEHLFCASPTLKDCPTWKDCPYCEAHARQSLMEEGWKRTMATKRGRAA